jgi:hypothetical protein
LTRVLKPGLHGHGGRCLEVRVREHDERIRPSQLEHRLLERLSRGSGDLLPGQIAAGERDGANPRISDQLIYRAAAEQERAKRAGREAGVAKHGFDRERALRYVGRVLQDGRVARHHGGRGETEDLPEREVPRHHREHDT